MAPGRQEDQEKTGARTKTVKTEREKHKFLPNHRMYRSPVRPFFCCGSQISLNSITEFKDGAASIEKDVDDDYEDITDSDDLLEEVDKLTFDSSPNKYERVSPRMGRTPLNGKRKKTSVRQDKSSARKKFWSLKLKGKLQVSKRSHYTSGMEMRPSTSGDGDICVCTSFKSKGQTSGHACSLGGAEGGRFESHGSGDVPLTFTAQVVPLPSSSAEGAEAAAPIQTKGKGKTSKNRKKDPPLPFINLNKLYPINDIDEQLIAQRRHEMEHGIEVEDIWVLKPQVDEQGPRRCESLTSIVCSTNIKKPVGQYPSYGAMALLSSEAGNLDPEDLLSKQHKPETDENMTKSSVSLDMSPWVQIVPLQSRGQQPQIHTQVDYIHFLVPDLEKIVRSSFYWGVMDRYQAEKLIENKPEGTFLLRDSAQDEFLFSVSFRRYGRSLHARIEQWNHKFSFDSRDPGVFSTDTVCGLINHYKDPSCCMFFEPMLTVPLARTFPFSLQHLARAAICSRITYDGISDLTLPRTLKEYLQFYHYKQKVRMRRFDNVA